MKRTILFLIIAVAVLYVGYLMTPARNAPPRESEEAVITNTNKTNTIKGMTIEDIKVGTGATADTGKLVSVHYVGTLTDGTKFDSSRDRGAPFSFNLGAGQVIEGWDKGVVGMKVGGVRKLTIPPDLAYGDRAIGSIPANSTLVFEVELLDVK